MPRIFKQADDELLFRKRHSLSHVLAQVVLEFWPEAQLGIGPPTKDGFYYDFLLPVSLTDRDLRAIETRMREIVKQGHRFSSRVISIEEGEKLFKNQKFKLELIELISSGKLDENASGEQGAVDKLSIYQHSSFIDLCRGPHVESLSEIDENSFCLTKVAGAYWRGDETREMLQRIYGYAFHTQEDLANYVQKIEDAKKYDHKVLGQSLKFFSVCENVGPGLILWLPKGALVRYLIEEKIRQRLFGHGYRFVHTPHIGKSILWETSGHLDNYRENMFPEMIVENDSYFLKPMNCPFHIEIFRTLVQSYKDLPLRLAEFGSVYRYERSGTLHGLTRVRGLTQDDGHIFCSAEQIKSEICSVLNLINGLLQEFNFNNPQFYLSTRPKDFSVGSDEIWQTSEQSLIDALDDLNLNYYVEEGGGAFYGPKIDVKVNDCFDREWQISTVQLDFNLPVRFGIYYTDSDGKKKHPIMIHRALLGSLERFFGLLLENYKGELPFWLSPEQIRLVTVSDKFNQFALELQGKLCHKFRVSIDASAERLSAKIRDAELEKVPAIITIGKKEIEERVFPVRLRQTSELKFIKEDELISYFSSFLHN